MTIGLRNQPSWVLPVIPGPALPVSGLARPAGGSWTLLFEDHFPGTSLDANKWYVEDGWANNNNVTTRAANVQVAGSMAELYLPDSANGAAINTAPEYVGIGKGCRLPVGGYIEFYAMFPGLTSSPWTPYNWSSTWTTSEDWPAAGEIDVFECYNFAGANYNGPSGAHPQNGAIAGNWVNSFHSFAAYRGATWVDYYWDAALVKHLTPTNDSGGGQEIRLTAGSIQLGWPAQYNSVASGIPALTVDYVRVWT